VEVKEEKDREGEYPKPLLEYKTFRFLHRYFLMSLLIWASTRRMNVFRIQHCCKGEEMDLKIGMKSPTNMKEV